MINEVFDQNLINFVVTKFSQINTNLRNLLEQKGNNSSKLNLELNKLLRISIYNSLEFEFNIPTINSLAPLQARFNFTFQDSQNFARSRYMFYQINTISLLYFCFEQFVDSLIEESKLNPSLVEPSFRNKFNVLINESSLAKQKEFRDCIVVFKILRHSFHDGGIYHGENQEFKFGNIEFVFTNGKAIPLSTSAFIFIIEIMINLVIDLANSNKFSKYFN